MIAKTQLMYLPNIFIISLSTCTTHEFHPFMPFSCYFTASQRERFYSINFTIIFSESWCFCCCDDDGACVENCLKTLYCISIYIAHV